MRGLADANNLNCYASTLRRQLFGMYASAEPTKSLTLKFFTFSQNREFLFLNTFLLTSVLRGSDRRNLRRTPIRRCDLEAKRVHSCSVFTISILDINKIK